MTKEIETLKRNDTWIITDLPHDKKSTMIEELLGAFGFFNLHVML